MIFPTIHAVRLLVGVAITAASCALGCGGKAQSDVLPEHGAIADASAIIDVGSEREALDAISREATADRVRTPEAALDAHLVDSGVAETSASAPDAPAPIAALRSLTIMPQSANLAVGGVVVLTVIATDAAGQVADVSAQVTFISSPDGVLQLTGNVATARRSGTAQITAAWRGALASTTITVQNRTVVELSVLSEPRTCSSRDDITFRAFATMSDGFREEVTSQVVWRSSNPMVVASGAQTTCVAPGSAIISATLGGQHAELKVDVVGAKLTKLQISGPAVIRPAAFGLFELQALYEDGSVVSLPVDALTWSSSNADVLSMVSTSSAQGRSVGTATITATLSGMVLASAKVVVTSAQLTALTLAPKTQVITMPASGELTATGTYSDGAQIDVTRDVQWEATPAATVIPGAVLPGSSGAMTVIARSGDGIVSDVASVTVLPGAPLSLVVGEDITVPRQLSRTPNVTALYAGGSALNVSGSVVWHVTDPTIVVATGATFVGTQPGRTTYYATLGALTSDTRNVTVSSATLLTIELDPTHLNSQLSEITQVRVLGTFDDGGQEDVTNDAVFKVGNVRVAAVSNDAASRGTLTGVGAGTTTITATVGAFTTSTTVTFF